MTQTMNQIKQLVYFHAPDKETLDRMLAFLDANDNLIAAQDRLIDAYKDNIKKQKQIIEAQKELCEMQTTQIRILSERNTQ
jgi:restriction endonuclease S subunit